MRLSSKKIKKEVRKTFRSRQEIPPRAVQRVPSLPSPIERPRKEQLSAKRKKEALTSLSKQMSRKKSRLNPANSKRTTPGEVEFSDAAPANVHKEGKRWIKTLQSQTNTRNVIMNRRGPKISRKTAKPSRTTGRR